MSNPKIFKEFKEDRYKGYKKKKKVDVRRSERIRKRRVQMDWLRLRDPKKNNPRAFRCFNKRDIGLNHKKVEKIIDAEQDDD